MAKSFSNSKKLNSFISKFPCGINEFFSTRDCKNYLFTFTKK
jgi:hypothetical protein